MFAASYFIPVLIVKGRASRILDFMRSGQIEHITRADGVMRSGFHAFRFVFCFVNLFVFNNYFCFHVLAFMCKLVICFGPPWSEERGWVGYCCVLGGY